jgi:hypothetical protein
MRFFLSAAVAALFWATSSEAQTPLEQSAVRAEMEGYVIRPMWLRRPSADDMRRLYPPQQKGVEGFVSADCLVDERGQFTSCEIVKETPAGMGFGESTIRLAKLFKMKPIDADGASVAGRKLRLPVRWHASLSR